MNQIRVGCFITLLLWFTFIGQGSEQALADFDTLPLDRVTVVVPDLGPVRTQLRDRGFKVQVETDASEGIRRGWVRFADQTALEIVSVEGEAKSRLSQFYRKLSLKGLKGGFVVLHSFDLKADRVRLEKAGHLFEPFGKTLIPTGPMDPYLFLLTETQPSENIPIHPNGALGFKQVVYQSEPVSQQVRAALEPIDLRIQEGDGGARIQRIVVRAQYSQPELRLGPIQVVFERESE